MSETLSVMLNVVWCTLNVGRVCVWFESVRCESQIYTFAPDTVNLTSSRLEWCRKTLGHGQLAPALFTTDISKTVCVSLRL